MIEDYLVKDNNRIDDYCTYLIELMNETELMVNKTYMTEETEDTRERRKRQAIEAQKTIQEKRLSQ